MAIPKIDVKIELVEHDPARHAPLLPSYFVTLTTKSRVGHEGGVWEETCHGRDQLELCLQFLRAGVALSGGYVIVPGIPTP